MNLKQERLLEIRGQKKKGLDNEVTETLTTQVSLLLNIYRTFFNYIYFYFRLSLIRRLKHLDAHMLSVMNS